jgi:hypothetical protein
LSTSDAREPCVSLSTTPALNTRPSYHTCLSTNPPCDPPACRSRRSPLYLPLSQHHKISDLLSKELQKSSSLCSNQTCNRFTYTHILDSAKATRQDVQLGQVNVGAHILRHVPRAHASVAPPGYALCRWNADTRVGWLLSPAPRSPSMAPVLFSPLERTLATPHTPS